MAQGDVVLFNQYKLNKGLKVFQLETDVIKVGLITNAVTPAATTADPRWGAGGTTNFSTNQVTPGGNYATGGPAAANNTYTQAAGVATFDADNIAIAQNASNPTNARWGILYDDTSAGKECIGFVDLGSVFDLSTGDLNINWHASGIYTMT